MKSETFSSWISDWETSHIWLVGTESVNKKIINCSIGLTADFVLVKEVGRALADAPVAERVTVRAHVAGQTGSVQSALTSSITSHCGEKSRITVVKGCLCNEVWTNAVKTSKGTQMRCSLSGVFFSKGFWYCFMLKVFYLRPGRQTAVQGRFSEFLPSVNSFFTSKWVSTLLRGLPN